MKRRSVTIRMKGIEQYFPLVLPYDILYKVVLSFEYMDQIPKSEN